MAVSICKSSAHFWPVIVS